MGGVLSPLVLLVGAGVHLLRVRWIREPYPAGAAGHLVEAEQASVDESTTDLGDPVGVALQEPSHDSEAGLGHAGASGQHPPHQPMTCPLATLKPACLTHDIPCGPRQLFPVLGRTGGTSELVPDGGRGRGVVVPLLGGQPAACCQFLDSTMDSLLHTDLGDLSAQLPREDWQASLLDTPRRTSSSSFFTTPSPRGHRSRESREMPA